VSDPTQVAAQIRAAFEPVEYPGDAYLLGSTEGGEPEEEVGPFRGTDWRTLEPEFVDRHAAALSFFSQAALRFFLPAYLLADLAGQLSTADPVFHLASAFQDVSIEIPVGERTFRRTIGRTQLVNPRRYGATTFLDYARWRLSVFTREESAAIVEYLEWRRETTDLDTERAAIDAALVEFWRPRAASAPTAESLQQHVADQATMVAAIQAQRAS
jgi:hypothetical protein